MRWMPLVMRELREQARRPVNHWLRVVGALVLILVTGVVLETASRSLRAGWMWRPVRGAGPPMVVVGGVVVSRVESADSGSWQDGIRNVLRSFEGKGGVVFQASNLVLLITIAMMGPLLTADSLSRERREGTLGLLFLTPLRPRDIVLAKLIAHGLRGVLVLVGSIPVLLLPLLLGGLSWVEVARAALLDFGALVLVLTAGMWASTRWLGPRAVMLGALISSAGSGLLWLMGWGLIKGVAEWRTGSGGGLLEELGGGVLRQLSSAVDLVGNVVLRPQNLWAYSAARPGLAGSMNVGIVLAVALGIGWFVFRKACRSVASAQLDEMAGGRMGKVEAALAGRMVFGRALTRLKHAVLGWSPHLWPELSSWRLRVAPWAMLLGIGFLELRMVADLGTSVWGPFPLSWVALGLASAFLGAAAFHRDRSSGVLELVLTTPGGVLSVLKGKLAAMALQVGPSWVFALLLEGSYARIMGLSPLEYLSTTIPVLGGFLALTLAAGAFFSLRSRAYVPAFLGTLAVTGAAGVMSQRVLRDFGRYWRDLQFEDVIGMACGFGLIAGLLALGFLFLLRRALNARKFPLA
ncbi:MAG: ABC transporter permease subunit [Limisphaerales bacterium]